MVQANSSFEYVAAEQRTQFACTTENTAESCQISVIALVIIHTMMPMFGSTFVLGMYTCWLVNE